MWKQILEGELPPFHSNLWCTGHILEVQFIIYLFIYLLSVCVCVCVCVCVYGVVRELVHF